MSKNTIKEIVSYFSTPKVPFHFIFRSLSFNGFFHKHTTLPFIHTLLEREGSITIPQSNNSATFSFHTILVFGFSTVLDFLPHCLYSPSRIFFVNSILPPEISTLPFSSPLFGREKSFRTNNAIEVNKSTKRPWTFLLLAMGAATSGSRAARRYPVKNEARSTKQLGSARNLLD